MDEKIVLKVIPIIYKSFAVNCILKFNQLNYFEFFFQRPGIEKIKILNFLNNLERFKERKENTI